MLCTKVIWSFNDIHNQSWNLMANKSDANGLFSETYEISQRSPYVPQIRSCFISNTNFLMFPIQCVWPSTKFNRMQTDWDSCWYDSQENAEIINNCQQTDDIFSSSFRGLSTKVMQSSVWNAGWLNDTSCANTFF